MTKKNRTAVKVIFALTPIHFGGDFYVSFILATPCLFLMLLLRGEWIYLGSTLAGFLMFATLPLGLVMAQTLAPHGKSMVSSLMMGLAQGVGGMMTPLVGSLADLYSIQTVLCVLALVPLLSIGLVWFFPEKRLRAQTLVG
jgi:MFS transporter, FSR family, fosmidomycin resistance protein